MRGGAGRRDAVNVQQKRQKLKVTDPDQRFTLEEINGKGESHALIYFVARR